MATAIRVPRHHDISRFFSDLLGLKTTATTMESAATDHVYAIATFVDEHGASKAAIATDLTSAAHLGAALTQIPSGAVADALNSGNLDANLCENLQEVFNISVNLFPESNVSRLVLQSTLFAAEAESTLASHLENMTAKWFSIDVQRYGSGFFCVLTPSG